MPFALPDYLNETDEAPPDSEGLDVRRYGNTYQFDFLAGDFVTDIDGDVVVLTETEALAQQVEKILRTRRYEDLVYGGVFGTDLYDGLADADETGAEEALLTSYVAEALLADRRISTVDALDVEITEGAQTEAEIEGIVVDTFGVETPFAVTVTTDA